ncbi:MAG: hypothetical protein SFW66_05780 [Gammaproteobacteria bacterium]|nr:hypothetical protein [Gammaproteobacteria bacterium]
MDAIKLLEQLAINAHYQVKGLHMLDLNLSFRKALESRSNTEMKEYFLSLLDESISNQKMTNLTENEVVQLEI